MMPLALLLALALQKSVAGSHYGDPVRGCLDDEEPVEAPGIHGFFCSPRCNQTQTQPCPQDVPSTVSAAPTCISIGGEQRCVLKCEPKTFRSQCGQGHCRQALGICTFDNHTIGGHYEDPRYGCQADEVVMTVKGHTGSFCSPVCQHGQCPMDTPAGIQAQPMCDRRWRRCVLKCKRGECGFGHCSGGYCTYGSNSVGNASGVLDPSPEDVDSPLTQNKYYGNPADGCRAGEVAVSIKGVTGSICSPACSQHASCPNDTRAGVTATPSCSLLVQGKRHCELKCSPGECGQAHCRRAVGVCTFDPSLDVSSKSTIEQGIQIVDSPQTLKKYYGNPADGCRPDEVAVGIKGVAGSFCSPACSLFDSCPNDTRAGVIATPSCSISVGGERHCVLKCSPGECGQAHCRRAVGVCTFDPSLDGSSNVMVSGEQVQIVDWLQAQKQYYGNPADGCREDEVAVGIKGVTGSFCSPACSQHASCPSDTRAGVTATPRCSLKDTRGQRRCALQCSPGECGQAHCRRAVGVCTYDPSMSNDTLGADQSVYFVGSPQTQKYYGNPADGCRVDEVAVSIEGVTGSFCSPACSQHASCPSDTRAGVTATPSCSLLVQGKRHCELKCSPGECGQAHCRRAAGVCTFDPALVFNGSLIVSVEQVAQIVVFV